MTIREKCQQDESDPCSTCDLVTNTLQNQKSHPKVAFANQLNVDYLEAAASGAAAGAASEAAGAAAGAGAASGAGAATGAGAGAASSFLPQADKAAAAAITAIKTSDLFI
nr:hypothetical protein [uncultured Rhodoferax sp.]